MLLVFDVEPALANLGAANIATSMTQFQHITNVDGIVTPS